MRLGQKSILFGSHQFILHPLMVAYGWRRHYGWWPKGWRTWVAIFVHDLGYWWCDDMDGTVGKLHPMWAALFCAKHFSDPSEDDWQRWVVGVPTPEVKSWLFWSWFVGAHSRYYAELTKQEVSPLMIPDKLATALLPRWLYCLLVWMSGEFKEYVAYSHAVGHTEVPTDAWGYSGWILKHWRGKFDQAGKTAVG